MSARRTVVPLAPTPACSGEGIERCGYWQWYREQQRSVNDPGHGNGRNSFRASWVVVIGFLLALMAGLLGIFGAGYAALDSRKADKATVEQIATDVREIRQFLLGPRGR